MKRSLLVIISITAFILIGFASAASAAQSGQCGDDVKWILDDNGKMKIYGKEEMSDIEIDSDADWLTVDRNSIKSLEIGDGVTSIGKRAFQNCKSLTSVSIAASVTNIKDLAFSGCVSLSSIRIPDGTEKIGESAFSGCEGLKTITLSNTLKTISNGAFLGCGNIKAIKIPVGVTHIGLNVFCDCHALDSVTVDEGNKRYYVENGVLFDRDNSTLVLYPEKKQGKTYNIPDGIKTIGENAFGNCTTLTAIGIPAGVTTIDNNAFSSCYSLSDIKLPDSVEAVKSSAFSGCGSLTEINIPKNVNKISQAAFADCVSLKNISVDTANQSYSSQGGILFNKDKTEIIHYPSQKADKEYTVPDSVVSIEDCAFDNCVSLVKITMPDSIYSIKTKAFAGCTSLTDIVIPDHVTKLDSGAFFGCDALESITIPIGITAIQQDAFAGCEALKDVYYSGSPNDWEKVTIETGNEAVENAAKHYKKGGISYKINDKNNAGQKLEEIEEILKTAKHDMDSYESRKGEMSKEEVNNKLREIFETVPTVFDSDPDVIASYEDRLARLRYDLDRLFLRVETEVPQILSVEQLTESSGVHIFLQRFYNVFPITCKAAVSCGGSGIYTDVYFDDSESGFVAKADINAEELALIPGADVVIEISNGSRALAGIYTVQDVSFDDVPASHWANPAISALYRRGIVTGMGDGVFAPDAQVTREAFVKMSVMAFGDSYSDGVSGFADDANSWYSPYIKSASDTGLVTGYADGRFGIGESISRQDIAVILWRRLGQPEAAAADFADGADIADYAKTAVAYLASKEIIKGYEDGTFRPNESATRAAAAKIIYGVIAD